jgi:hypothetical protein
MHQAAMLRHITAASLYFEMVCSDHTKEVEIPLTFVETQ